MRWGGFLRERKGLEVNLFPCFSFNDVMIAFFGSVFAFFFLLMTDRQILGSRVVFFNQL